MKPKLFTRVLLAPKSEADQTFEYIQQQDLSHSVSPSVHRALFLFSSRRGPCRGLYASNLVSASCFLSFSYPVCIHL